jgi:hypothetical protein
LRGATIFVGRPTVAVAAFQSHGIKYLVVGGFAVIYRSRPRFTRTVKKRP